jgi:uncharacterized membrane protein YqaE (UPF0057 family)
VEFAQMSISYFKVFVLLANGLASVAYQKIIACRVFQITILIMRLGFVQGHINALFVIQLVLNVKYAGKGLT